MALDTREKRMNAARVGRPWMRAKHAVGGFDEQARIASGHGYGGNALSPAGASAVPALDEGMLVGGLMPLAGGLA